MSDWIYKGYGRIYTNSQENVEKVKDILNQIDKDEWEGYAPDDIVGVWVGHHDLRYISKFEPNIEELYKRCLSDGLPIWPYSQYKREGE